LVHSKRLTLKMDYSVKIISNQHLSLAWDSIFFSKLNPRPKLFKAVCLVTNQHLNNQVVIHFLDNSNQAICLVNQRNKLIKVKVIHFSIQNQLLICLDSQLLAAVYLEIKTLAA